MEFYADLHLHSHYSMATSKDCIPPIMAQWAQRKGLRLIGTGDCTHPGWRRELRDWLVPAEDGFYRLKDGLSPAVRFVVTGEISTVFKRADQTRKVHSLVVLPSLEAADQIAAQLERIGNLGADGRPILKLDCYDLLAMCLEACPEVIFIPAHIWTPHYSVLGAFSRFQSMEECFGDLASQIYAVETGLSSDTPMNWRVPALDRFTLVSNSDAHSPRNLAREATVFACDPGYGPLLQALKTGAGFVGTIEFYPEEGKYHYDGHRKCGVSLHPRETNEFGGRCPVCGKKLTVGVLHRIESLTDKERPAGFEPRHAPRFERLVPLADLLAATLKIGVQSKKVVARYDDLLREFQSELAVLREVAPEEIKRVAGPEAAMAVARSRSGQLEVIPGFDGEYGRIMVNTVSS